MPKIIERYSKPPKEVTEGLKVMKEYNKACIKAIRADNERT